MSFDIPAGIDDASLDAFPSFLLHPLLTPYIPPFLLTTITNRHLLAFALSLIASMGTFLGGLLVLILVKLLGSASSSSLVGTLQAFSAGVMIYMTFIDLIPEAMEAIGSRETMGWFFLGVAVFGVLETVVVPGEHDHDHGGEKEKEEESTASLGSKEGTPRASLGSKDGDGDEEEENEEEPLDEIKTPEGQKMLMRTGWITFYAMMLHNMPEGLGVYISALNDVKLGLQLAIAICLHNIPEGMAVAIPLHAANAGPLKVLWLTLLNGLAEPLGVILGAVLLGPWLTSSNLSRCLAAVGGIMCCISLHELLPTAVHYAGRARATLALFSGMLVVFLALEAVNEFFGGAGHHHHGGGHGHGHGHEVKVDMPVAVPKAPVFKMGPVSGVFVGQQAHGGGGGGQARAHSHGFGNPHGGHGHEH